MRFSLKVLALVQIGTAVWTVFTPQFAFAYDHPLSEEEVREAYFVGQDAKNVNKVLSKYFRGLPVPQRGPHVAEIQLRTPYAQVVEDSAQHSVGYSDMQAAESYRKRGDFIAVRLKILFTPTYRGRSDDFWRGVSVALVQNNKHVEPTSLDGRPTPDWSLDGADVFVKFSVADVESDSLQVEVIPPDGPPVHATFDLKSLR
jgi:hypothetical protein